MVDRVSGTERTSLIKQGTLSCKKKTKQMSIAWVEEDQEVPLILRWQYTRIRGHWDGWNGHGRL